MENSKSSIYQRVKDALSNDHDEMAAALVESTGSSLSSSEIDSLFDLTLTWTEPMTAQALLVLDPRQKEKMSKYLLINEMDAGVTDLLPLILKYVPVDAEIVVRAAQHHSDFLMAILPHYRGDMIAILNRTIEFMVNDQRLIREVRNEKLPMPKFPHSLARIVSVVDILVADKRTRIERMDVPTLRLLLWVLGIDKRLDRSLYSTVTAFILIKNPTDTELIDWMIELRERNLSSAAGAVLDRRLSDDVSVIPFQALLMALLYPSMSKDEIDEELRELGARDDSIREARALLDCCR